MFKRIWKKLSDLWWSQFLRRPAAEPQPAGWPPLPEPSEREKARGLTWVRAANGQPMLVCDFCGGNCGQCGVTSLVGNVPFDLQRMVNNLHGGGGRGRR